MSCRHSRFCLLSGADRNYGTIVVWRMSNSVFVYVTTGKSALFQILLMIFLGRPELGGRDDLGSDRPVESTALIKHALRLFGLVFLFGRMEEDSRSILGTVVRSLPVDLSRIVIVPECT